MIVALKPDNTITSNCYFEPPAIIAWQVNFLDGRYHSKSCIKGIYNAHRYVVTLKGVNKKLSVAFIKASSIYADIE